MIAWFVSGFDPTLPVGVYSVLVAVIDPSLNAIGTIVFGISALVLVAIEILLFKYAFKGEEGEIAAFRNPALPAPVQPRNRTPKACHRDR